MPLTDWKSVGSDGVIADTPASQFQYRYSVNNLWNYATLQSGGTMYTDRWTVRILDSGDALLFRQEVAVTYLFTYMGSGSMLIFFTWYISSADVETTDPEDAEFIGDDEGYATPASGSDYTAAGGRVMYDWHSPVFQIPLPEGAYFDIEFHTTGQPDLWNPLAAVQTRVASAGGLAGARMSADGMMRVVRPADGGLQFVSSGDPRGFDAVGPGRWSDAEAPSSPQVEAALADESGDAQIFYLHEITPVVLYDTGSEIRAKQSPDDGRTWGEAMDVVSGVRMTAADIGPDGGTIYVVGSRDGSPVVVVCSMERDEDGAPVLRASQEWPAAGIDSLPTGLQFMRIQNGEAHLLVDDSGTLRYYLSTDGLRSWQT